jgi:hypothetical protein
MSTETATKAPAETEAAVGKLFPPGLEKILLHPAQLL